MKNSLSQNGNSVIDLNADKIVGESSDSIVDVVSVEEPLEICINAEVGGQRQTVSVAVTMRTPGDDIELAAGFLFTEGIISSADEIKEIRVAKCNLIVATIKSGVQVAPHLLERHSFMASSCGVCGKKSIAAIRVRSRYELATAQPILTPEIMHSLPDKLVAAQKLFTSTGGIHASALFHAGGDLISLREDVGRHNALDKVIGEQLLQGKLPLTDTIIMVSGRASFELVQKAAQSGVPVLAAVGAPSSLAVELAQESGMTLLGFVRDRRFNVYTGRERIITLQQMNQFEDEDARSGDNTIRYM